MAGSPAVCCLCLQDQSECGTPSSKALQRHRCRHLAGLIGEQPFAVGLARIQCLPAAPPPPYACPASAEPLVTNLQCNVGT